MRNPEGGLALSWCLVHAPWVTSAPMETAGRAPEGTWPLDPTVCHEIPALLLMRTSAVKLQFSWLFAFLKRSLLEHYSQAGADSQHAGTTCLLELTTPRRPWRVFNSWLVTPGLEVTPASPLARSSSSCCSLLGLSLVPSGGPRSEAEQWSCSSPPSRSTACSPKVTPTSAWSRERHLTVLGR